MARPRIILDTNVLVSALLTPGDCRQIVDSWMHRTCFDIVTCPRLTLELERVVRRRKIRAYVSLRASDALLSALTVGALWFPDPVASSFRLRDGSDEFIAQLALDAEAELLVSGDRDVLTLGHQDTFRCIAPRDGVAIIERWCE